MIPGFSRRALCLAPADNAAVCGTAISEEDKRKSPYSFGTAAGGDTFDGSFDTILPVFFVFDCKGGVCRTKEVSIEAWVIAPSVCVGVDEESSVDRWRAGLWVSAKMGCETVLRLRQRRVESRVPECLNAKEEFGDKVVVVS